jgi:hypothetical protein
VCTTKMLINVGALLVFSLTWPLLSYCSCPIRFVILKKEHVLKGKLFKCQDEF